MRQDSGRVILEAFVKFDAVGMRVLSVRDCALHEVSQKSREDLDFSAARRKRRDFLGP